MHFPGNSAGDASNCVVEILGRAGTARRHAHYAFGTAPSLRSRIAHPGFHEPFGFQAIEGRIEGSDGTAAAGCVLDFLSDRGSISTVAQTRRGGEHQVLEFPKHITIAL